MRNTTVLSLLLALAGCRSATSEQSETEVHEWNATLVIEDVTLVDGRTGEKTKGVTIVVDGDRIVAIESFEGVLPPDVRVIDGSGKWVVPGFIDVHVHDASEAYLRDMLAWGVTAVQLMPHAPPESPTAGERDSESSLATIPRLQLTEIFAGAFPDNLFPGVYQFIKPTTVDEARQSVQASHAEGYRQIKIIRDDSFLWSGESYRVPMLPEAVFDALVAEAHALDMRVYVHATSRDVAQAALAAGVDAFLHATMDLDLSAADWQSMAAARTVWTPTVHALFCFGDQRSYARRVLADERFTALLEESERAQWRGMAEAENPIVLPPMASMVENKDAYVATIGRNTRRARDAGVTVAVGTDGGPGGISTHIEFGLLQARGLSATEVLRAATHGGAIALGRKADLGSLEVGKLADMVVLNADPTEDVRNWREIEWVIKGGQAYRSRQLALGE